MKEKAKANGEFFLRRNFFTKKSLEKSISKHIIRKEVFFMRRTFFSIFLCLCLLPRLALADNLFQERTIGAAFKGLAKTYLGVYDFEKGKRAILKSLESMNAARFRKLYAQLWPFLKDMPEHLQKKYRFVTMTQERMIRTLKTIQKKEIGILIDHISDQAIYREYERNVGRFGGNSKDFLQEFRNIQMYYQKFLDDIQVKGEEEKTVSVEVSKGTKNKIIS